MNENLDLTIILDGCPEGTLFYSSIYDEVKFLHIDKSLKCPIVVIYDYDHYSFFSKDARLIQGRGECTLFPSKDQRDWSKFVRFWDKPKVEKFDPSTLQPFDKVLVRDVYKGCWACTLFSHIDNDMSFPVYCSSDCFATCIPYNEETKHLVGTTEDCPEYYKWW